MINKIYMWKRNEKILDIKSIGEKRNTECADHIK